MLGLRGERRGASISQGRQTRNLVSPLKPPHDV